MSVDRLSVTVPSELGAVMRTKARARGETVSTFVAESIAQRLRHEALGEALAAADRQFGPLPVEEIDRTVAELRRAMKKRRAPARHRR